MPKRNHTFTLGIEEEFQIIDPNTRQLVSHIQQILAGGKMILKERVKPEMHQSVVELGTEVCNDVRAARKQVIELRSQLATVAAQGGLKIASAGTHPFSHWQDQLITADERYATLVLSTHSFRLGSARAGRTTKRNNGFCGEGRAEHSKLDPANEALPAQNERRGGVPVPIG